MAGLGPVTVSVAQHIKFYADLDGQLRGRPCRTIL